MYGVPLRVIRLDAARSFHQTDLPIRRIFSATDFSRLLHSSLLVTGHHRARMCRRYFGSRRRRPSLPSIRLPAVWRFTILRSAFRSRRSCRGLDCRFGPRRSLTRAICSTFNPGSITAKEFSKLVRTVARSGEESWSGSETRRRHDFSQIVTDLPFKQALVLSKISDEYENLDFGQPRPQVAEFLRKR